MLRKCFLIIKPFSSSATNSPTKVSNKRVTIEVAYLIKLIWIIYKINFYLRGKEK